jgi:hypothetical protein
MSFSKNFDENQFTDNQMKSGLNGILIPAKTRKLNNQITQ